MAFTSQKKVTFKWNCRCVPLLNGFLPQSLVTLPVLAQEPTPLQFPQCFHAEEKEIGLDHYEITM